MPEIFVYSPTCEDFDNLGLAGSLFPTSCIHTEIKNGMSEIELVHPIDDMGKWAFLKEEYILVVEVPVRTIPEITPEGLIVTSIEKWKVRLAATKTERKVYSKSSGGKLLKTLNVGAAVTVTAKYTSRYKIKTGKLTGYMAIAALENQVIETIANDPNAIQSAVPPWSIRPQRFRIYKVTTKDSAQGESEVVVLAKHIFYDHAKNVTTYSSNNPTCLETLAGLVNGCSVANELVGTTNLLDRRVGIKYERVKFTEAILAPETGVCDKWGVEIVRDNEEFVMLRSAGMNRGVRIAAGKNLRGVECKLDMTDVVTRYIPVGQNSKGGLLLVYPGTYSTDHGSVVIPAGCNWLESSNAGSYAIPYVEKLDTGVKASGTSDANVKDAREAMIDFALDKFENDQPQFPSITLEVDFVQLGDTDEYAQYKELENVYLYDTVKVYHPKIGVDVLAQITEYEWDVCRARAVRIVLGSVRPQNRGMLPTWKLPAVIPGERVGAVSALVSSGEGISIQDGVLYFDMTESDTAEEKNALQIVIRNEVIVNPDTGETKIDDVVRYDKDGAYMQNLVVDKRIDYDGMACRYKGAAVFNDVEDFTELLDALNLCFLDFDVTINIKAGITTISSAIEFVGIHGSGSITIFGNETSATAGVHFKDCTCKIEVHELYAAYFETRSPYVTYVDCSQTGSYTASGTMTGTANPTRTRRSSWLSTTDEFWQGYTSSSGRHYGVIWFPDLDAYSGANILTASLRLKRVPASGQGGAITVKAYIVDNTSPSGVLANPTSPVTLGTISNNETKTFALPAAMALALCAGKGLVLDPGNTETMSGQVYSADYGKFYGVGSGFEPFLSFTYELAGQTVTKDSTFTRDNENEPEWSLIDPTNGTTSDTSYGNGKLRYRKIGNHIYVAGGVTIAWTGAAKTICTLPFAPAFANQGWFKSASGDAVIRIYVGTNGALVLEWVKSLVNAATITNYNSWIDCNIDFWID